MLGEMVDGSQRKKKEKKEDMDELQNPSFGKMHVIAVINNKMIQND